MSANYVTFKKFPDPQSAMALQQFLIENGIECILKDTSPSLDSNFSGNLAKEFEVQLSPYNFERADSLLQKHAENQLNSLPADYYLLNFSDEELFDVVLKHDEWSEFDYVLARRLLAERGKAFDEGLIKSLRDQRISDLAKPEESQTGWVVMGYVLALLGGFFGFITGYVLWTSHKTLPNGQVVPTYSATDRMHGKIILIIGLVILVLSAILWILREGR